MVFHVSTTLPFGDLVFAGAYSGYPSSLEVRRVEISPTLPEGMAVDNFAAFLVRLTTSDTLHEFNFECSVSSVTQKGAPNSGEHLDAQSWHIGNGLLMIGTEDGESLDQRIDWLSVNKSNYPVSYLLNGFRLSFSYVPPHQQVDFHFIVAHNAPTRDCDSEWFAVDIPHAKLLASPSTPIPNTA